MDEEESFARLLSASTPAPRPTLYTSSSDADPWADPFGGWGAEPSLPTPPARDPEPQPPSPERAFSELVNSTPSFASPPAFPAAPDPPSVIHARERELAGAGGSGFDDYSGSAGWPGASPSSARGPSSTHSRSPRSPTSPSTVRAQAPPSPTSPTSSTATNAAARRSLPAGLIDEDLLAEHDPRASLTRAFVKSQPAPVPAAPAHETKAYVFRTGKDTKDADSGAKAADKDAAAGQDDAKAKTAEDPEESSSAHAPTPTISAPADPSNPATVPLPASSAPTPTVSRPNTPAQREREESPATAASATAPGSTAPGSTAPGSPRPAPHGDRVSVSPLETPERLGTSDDYGFRSLAIGANGTVPTQSPPASLGPRFGGRGWGAVDDEGPLTAGLGGFGGFGAGGAGGGGGFDGDPWSDGTQPLGQDRAAEAEADGEDDSPSSDDTPLSASGPSRLATSGVTAGPPDGSTPASPRRSKLLSTPVFQIAVGDPTKVGDPVRGHVVYTVRTKTTSPHYRRGEFSVLRRFSDFLWLFDALTANNPGVIVPPVPDKQPFGRFQDQFIETRRAALQRCLGKMAAHPILQLDPDLRLFLESDSFALDVKNRRPLTDAAPSPGLLGGWGLTGPRYVEHDEWFDQRKAYLDHLETQLKSFAKALDSASKARADMAAAVGDVADAAAALADSDLGAAMAAALARLAELARKEKIMGEEQATADVTQLLNLADEYVRFIASVRLAFAARVKAYHAAQAAEKDVGRAIAARDKARQQGKPVVLHEVPDAERRWRDATADFDAQSKLVKSEFARFERERVDEFRRTLASHLDAQLGRQRALVTAWEEYHAMLLKMVQRAQAVQQQQMAAAAQAQAQAAQQA